MTTKSRADSSGSRIHQPIDETRDETREWANQNNDNLAHLLEIWDELLCEHPRKWVSVWGDRQVLVGDTLSDVRDPLPDDERRECLVRFTVPYMQRPFD